MDGVARPSPSAVQRGGGRPSIDADGRRAEDVSSLREEDVQDFCRGQISRFKIPRYVFFVDSFPMTASEKIQKYKLREQGLQLLKERGVEIV